MSDYSVSDVSFDFFAVKVFGCAVAGAEVVEERTYWDTSGMEESAVLYECTEGGCARSETGHYYWLKVRWWKLRDGRK
jgi:hypothetical protein